MIELKVRVFATLRRHLEGYDGEEILIEMSENATVSDVLEYLSIPDREVKQVFVDNRKATVETMLNDGARVSIFPPIAGG